MNFDFTRIFNIELIIPSVIYNHRLNSMLLFPLSTDVATAMPR